MMNPQFLKLPKMKFVGCKEFFDPQKGDFSGIMKAWERLFQQENGSIKHEVKNDQFWGVTSDIEKTLHSYIAGGLVSKFDKELSGLSTFETEEQDFVMFEHHGSPEKMGETIQKAFQWIQQSKYELNGNFNLEMYDSRCNPENRENYIVELYFPVK